MGFLWGVYKFLESVSVPSLMLLYPLYASVRSLESPSKIDDQQWLTYWIIYSFITLLEMAAGPAPAGLSWMQPLWKPLKLGFIAWLVLPQFQGASFIYQRLVREQLSKCKIALDKHKENGEEVEADKESWLQGINPTQRKALQRFIAENGAEALDSVFEAARNELQKSIRSQQQSFKEGPERS